mmetsp:Transcript_47909/g.113858  ORF Transcript_47909/g.113858 Transcript_47909/m.113858 type:complete len:241 (-) Transcript_47909:896-1618(-)
MNVAGTRTKPARCSNRLHMDISAAVPLVTIASGSSASSTATAGDRWLRLRRGRQGLRERSIMAARRVKIERCIRKRRGRLEVELIPGCSGFTQIRPMGEGTFTSRPCLCNWARARSPEAAEGHHGRHARPYAGSTALVRSPRFVWPWRQSSKRHLCRQGHAGDFQRHAALAISTGSAPAIDIRRQRLRCGYHASCQGLPTSGLRMQRACWDLGADYRIIGAASRIWPSARRRHNLHGACA